MLCATGARAKAPKASACQSGFKWPTRVVAFDMPIAIAFDVYGTLVDRSRWRIISSHWLEIEPPASPSCGAPATGVFVPPRADARVPAVFGLHREALLYTESALAVVLAQESRTKLMERYRNLPPFPDAAPGLASIKDGGRYLAAFSNGEAEAVREVLENAGLLSLLDDVVSADEVRTFKPDPAIYTHAVRRLGQPIDATWMVSSNPFDIIGAKTAGLRTAWIKRDPGAVFDPWGVEPDLVVSSLDQLAPLL